MLSERQEKILQLLVREYIGTASPISSELLKERLGFDISPATIRNELQALAESGYLAQPHTSAGRVPTNKGYQLFIEITFTPEKPKLPDYIIQEIAQARRQVLQQLRSAEELAQQLRHTLARLDEARDSTRPASSAGRHENIFDILTIIINYSHGKPRK